MLGLVRELRQSLRTLLVRHNRAYTLASVAMLALGIGAVTAIFAVLHALLLAPLPYREAESVHAIVDSRPTDGIDTFSISAQNYVSWAGRLRHWSGVAAYGGANVNLGGGGSEAERVEAVLVTPNFWQVLGLDLVAGRTFVTAEDVVDAPVAVIGEQLWRDRYGADPAVIGRTLRVDGIVRTIVGIAPRDAGFTDAAAVWLPLGVASQPWGRGDRRLAALGRVAPGSSISDADAELRAVSAALAAEFPDDNRDWITKSQPVRDALVGAPLRARVLMLAGAVLVLLLVVCINVANLQLARASTRGRELGVRQALGATRARLMRQVIVECLVIAGAGGALGIALAWASIGAMASQLSAVVPRLAGMQLDWPIATLAIALAALTAVACGLVPAWVASRTHATAALQGAGRGATDARRTPLRQALVVAQFALATLLVAASALLVQQFQAIQRASLGFSPERVLSARVNLPDDDNGTNYARNIAEYERLLSELRALPGVERAGLGSEVPLGQVNTTSMGVAAGAKNVAGARNGGLFAQWRVVSPDFLETLGVQVRHGRAFAEGEHHHSILLSESLARRLWPNGENPLERDVTLGNSQTYRVVGVVGDVRLQDRAGELTPTMYMPTTWAMLSTMTVALRTRGDPAAAIAAVRDTAARVLPEFPMFDVRTMSDVADANVAEPRAQTAVVTLFGLASLLLAALGVGGVTAFLVARRTPELAVRMALGASPPRIVGDVVARGGSWCVLGIAAGALVTALLARTAGSVVDISAAPLGATLALVALALAAVGVVACWLPARRATRISPSLALRGE